MSTKKTASFPGKGPAGFSYLGTLDIWDLPILFLLTVTVFVTRQIFAGPVYFVDGPLLVSTIRLKWFVVQSPGYWLYAHLGGLFVDPATGLAFWNKLFSALGGACFFLLARMLGVRRWLALLAALTYSTLYHVWFAGEIHSSYAAEILFPILTLCSFLKLQQTRTLPWSALTALSSGLAIALRPSDGIFLLPLWAYLLWRGRYSWKVLVTFLTVSVLVFAAWYLPTEQAARRVGFNGTESQVMICLRATSVFLVGVNGHSLANIGRVYIPLFMACWPLLPLVFRRRAAAANGVLLLWTVPGLLFFTFGYMADPTYIVFLSGAFVLAVLLQGNTRAAYLCLSACLLWNGLLFTMARPVGSKSTIGLVWNYSVPKYCAYGIRHRWMATMAQDSSTRGLY